MMQDQQLAPADLMLPNKLRILPLQVKPIFPGLITPLIIGDQKEIALIDEALSSDQLLGLVLTKEQDENHPRADQLYKVGTVARILKRINLPDGGMNIILTTLKRFTIKKVIQDQGPIVVAVDYPEENIKDNITFKALARSLLSEVKQISDNNPLISEEMRFNVVNIDHPGKIADFIANMLNLDRKDQQKILETFDVQQRMEQVLVHIKKEQELLRIQRKIQSQINEKIEKSQREYFLREQLKLIKQELGIAADSKTGEYQRFQTAIEKLGLEGETRDQVNKELEKFSLMDPNGSEYHVTRNYLETIISLPWQAPKLEHIDIKRAKRILDSDHYGLEDVKERILEFIAVRSLKKDFRGSILCLVGPPGVGKTSIGRSIAKALKREFFRFSVGGMRDEAEIKGHRRTYVGAMPGKILQGLKVVKTRNTVFMIDEIDKLGSSFQGDPSSALLEVLDPEQNTSFRDHYLDLAFDISPILFIATANTLDTIPGPLLDRMEVIRLSGYTSQEKIQIAKSYIVPKSIERNGLPKDAVNYSKKALLTVAESYAREAGVRNFEKQIDKINRKIARKHLSEDLALPLTIEHNDIETYLGKPLFKSDATIPVNKPGIVTGLAWTSFGGDTLTIEAILVPGKEGLTLTGQMGNVMQESASIAYSWVRSVASKFGVNPELFSKNGIHLHIPAGATPKDGPSAGITMASCLLSLVSGNKVRKSLAMTGELSLSGLVLPIGGLKEKSIAALRSGIQDILIPKDNERDLDDVPENVKKSIRFHPVAHMDQALPLIFDLSTAETKKKA